MKRTFLRILPLFLASICSLAQTTPAIPAPPNSGFGFKVGVIDMQSAIADCNEGKRDLGAIEKKFEPRRAELQNLNIEIENLKKQLSTTGDKMTSDAHEAMVK